MRKQLTTLLGICALALCGTSVFAQKNLESAPSESQAATMPPHYSAVDRLQKNPRLSSELQALLPQGMEVETAAAGFSSVRTFDATVRAANDTGISFDELKMKVIGGERLTSAVHDLNPQLNAKAEVHKAWREAKEDIRATRS